MENAGQSTPQAFCWSAGLWGRGHSSSETGALDLCKYSKGMKFCLVCSEEVVFIGPDKYKSKDIVPQIGGEYKEKGRSK